MQFLGPVDPLLANNYPASEERDWDGIIARQPVAQRPRLSRSNAHAIPTDTLAPVRPVYNSRQEALRESLRIARRSVPAANRLNLPISMGFRPESGG
jgi:hypothetical protein